MEMLDILFYHGADPNIGNNHGITPLHRTANLRANQYQIAVAAKLLEHNANVRIMDYNGITTSEWAENSSPDGRYEEFPPSFEERLANDRIAVRVVVEEAMATWASGDCESNANCLINGAVVPFWSEEKEAFIVKCSKTKLVNHQITKIVVHGMTASVLVVLGAKMDSSDPRGKEREINYYFLLKKNEKNIWEIESIR